MVTVQTIQRLLALVVVVAAVVVLVKIAAAVIVNKLRIPLICEHLLFCKKAGAKLLCVVPFIIM